LRGTATTQHERHDDPLLAARAASLGVDAITSDCPSDLRSRMAAQTAARAVAA